MTTDVADRINVMQPWLGEEEIAAVAEVIRSGWVAQGPQVAAFEAAFADRRSRSRTPCATSSCTTALHLALVVAGVGPGDEVVVPSFSFIATANAAELRRGHARSSPTSTRVTGNLTAATVDRAVTSRTRAVIVVDQGGVPVDLDADPRSCATRAGSSSSRTLRARPARPTADGPVGAGADVAAWSFHPRKILTTGEGGMLTTAACRLGGSRAAAARARHERLRRGPPPQRAWRRPKSTSRSATTSA